jgi:hypothetical protein
MNKTSFFRELSLNGGYESNNSRWRTWFMNLWNEVEFSERCPTTRMVDTLLQIDSIACLGKFAVLQALWAREAGSKLRPGGGRVGYVAPSRVCVTVTA